MRELEICQDQIKYYVDDHGSLNYDKSWILDLNSIKAIGIVNRMRGDDDSYFLIFVDKSNQKYYINLNIKFGGYTELIDWLRFSFSIEEKDLIVPDEMNDNLILFPIALKGKAIYKKKNFLTKIKLLLGLKHVAFGELSEII